MLEILQWLYAKQKLAFASNFALSPNNVAFQDVKLTVSPKRKKKLSPLDLTKNASVQTNGCSFNGSF